jgi:hypothetical protein
MNSVGKKSIGLAGPVCFFSNTLFRNTLAPRAGIVEMSRDPG